ncbi:hypothetical protein AMECASPLE_030554 [Ameca splendens]|uniref:Uncharacterized protein n=1 Tax=Ameca splendens TaxID=208324 RepID=A0ABV0Y6A9_9TELE
MDSPRPEFLPLLPPGQWHAWPHGTPSAASRVPQANQNTYCQCPPPGSGIADVRGTSDLTATLTIEVENMVHSDSMSPTSPAIWSKLSQRWKLNTSLGEGSARQSQKILTIHLGIVCLAFSSLHFRQSTSGTEIQ